MSTNERMADSIDVLMHQQDRTNKELAELLGTSRNRAGAIRAGRANLNAMEIYQVAQWLGVTVENLATGYKLVPVKAAA